MKTTGRKRSWTALNDYCFHSVWILNTMGFKRQPPFCGHLQPAGFRRRSNPPPFVCPERSGSEMAGASQRSPAPVCAGVSIRCMAQRVESLPYPAYGGVCCTIFPIPLMAGRAGNSNPFYTWRSVLYHSSPSRTWRSRPKACPFPSHFEKSGERIRARA